MKTSELSVEESIDALLAPPEPVTPNKALQFCFDVTYGYIHRISDRFKPGLAFSDRGLARAASVCGWLCGIANGGNVALANELAENFIENLEYLSSYGGEVDYAFKYCNGEDATRKIPAYVVGLSDDGTAHGFALLWYRPLLTEEILARHRELGRDVVRFSYDEIPHGFAFNGGLIYHGPGAGGDLHLQHGQSPVGSAYMKARPTPERIRDLLNYDPDTGVFTWRVPRRGRRADGVAGSKAATSDGYQYICVDFCRCSAHRLAWAYVHGVWPSREIDHRNMDRTDNRIANLREATHGENQRNRPMRRGNSSGFKGVYFCKHKLRWCARISRDRVAYMLGYFKTPEAASAAYEAKAAELFGEFRHLSSPQT